MKKTFFAVAIAAALLSNDPSFAQTGAVQTKIDMAKISCAEVTQSYVDEFVVVAAWMSGYYNAKQNNTLVDVNQLAANAKGVSNICKDNPKMTVMEAITKLSGTSK